ncbi:hypothetical protein SAMN02745704_01602 [Paucidesulfovibrio gracilis DSM 16080]|uniref:Uncharacterized protein n=1 Tax=Paucidesulfovibrio gracilis DSM 16080 TaxID=1121449 RepID=A0A1T4X0L7_9BACT|nr:hypothetical protein [Paucidesulfovibrio gracilis]SKA83203.1 hypothetical protein SAMN02745704_01602 [Paucidesulfovibrio gracilis DSM 16080]
MCKLIPYCPFYKAYANVEDPFVQDVLARYCHAEGEGCAQREAQEMYGTFLGVNLCPGGEVITG